MKISFEKTGCGRCRGEGYIPHYSHVEHGVCFRCGGSGKLLTKKGAAAKTIYRQALTVPASALEPGMVIWDTEVIPFTNQIRTVREVIQTIEASDAESLTIRFVTPFKVSHMPLSNPVQQALTHENKEVARAALTGIAGVSIKD